MEQSRVIEINDKTLEEEFLEFADLTVDARKLIDNSNLTFEDYCKQQGIFKNNITWNYREKLYSYSITSLVNEANKFNIQVDADRLTPVEYNGEEYHYDNPVEVFKNVVKIFCIAMWVLLFIFGPAVFLKNGTFGSMIKVAACISICCLIITCSVSSIYYSNAKEQREKSEDHDNYKSGIIDLIAEKLYEKNEYTNLQNKFNELKDKVRSDICSRFDESRYIELSNKFGYGDYVDALIVQDVAKALRTHRAETLKDAYEIADNNRSDLINNLLREAEEEDRMKQEAWERSEYKRREHEAREAAAEADRKAKWDAQQNEYDHKRKVDTYARACHDYEIKSQFTKLNGQSTIDAARQRRDKAFADLYK